MERGVVGVGGPPANIDEVAAACADGNFDQVREMFPRLADKNAKDKDGDTCLHKAVMGDQAEIVGWLMDQGCDHTIQNGSGFNCVILATEEAAMSAAKVLAEKGANG
eukprot:284136_1